MPAPPVPDDHVDSTFLLVGRRRHENKRIRTIQHINDKCIHFSAGKLNIESGYAHICMCASASDASVYTFAESISICNTIHTYCTVRNMRGKSLRPILEKTMCKSHLEWHAIRLRRMRSAKIRSLAVCMLAVHGSWTTRKPNKLKFNYCTRKWIKYLN